jgi:hypothetical protein
MYKVEANRWMEWTLEVYWYVFDELNNSSGKIYGQYSWLSEDEQYNWNIDKLFT